jgi:hypothetical protein
VEDAENNLRQLKVKRWSQRTSRKDEQVYALQDINLLRGSYNQGVNISLK